MCNDAQVETDYDMYLHGYTSSCCQTIGRRRYCLYYHPHSSLAVLALRVGCTCAS